MSTKLEFNPLLEEGLQKVFISDFYTQTVQTTDATALVPMPLSKGIVEDSVVSFITRITAIEGATGDCWIYEFRGAITRMGAVTYLVDTVTSEYIAASPGAALWSVSFVANDTTEALDIKVTGEAAHIIEWTAVTVFNETTF